MSSIQNNNINSQLEKLHQSDSNNNQRSDLVDSLVEFRDKINNVRDGLDEGFTDDEKQVLDTNGDGVVSNEEMDQVSEGIRIGIRVINDTNNPEILNSVDLSGNGYVDELDMNMLRHITQSDNVFNIDAPDNHPGLIDVSNLTEDEAQELFNQSLASYRDASRTHSESIAMGQDVSSNENLNVQKQNLVNLVDNFDLELNLSEPLAFQLYNKDLNEGLKNNIGMQIEQFNQLDTDLARASISDLNVQSEIAGDLINFHDEEVNFLTGLNKRETQQDFEDTPLHAAFKFDLELNYIRDLENTVADTLVNSIGNPNTNEEHYLAKADLMLSDANVSGLSEQYGFKDLQGGIDIAKNEYFVELNGALAEDLQNQFDQFNNLDSDLARASQADLRVQMALTDSITDFYTERNEFWEGISGSPDLENIFEVQKLEDGSVLIPDLNTIDGTIKISNDEEAQILFDDTLNTLRDTNNTKAQYIALDTDMLNQDPATLMLMGEYSETVLTALAENFNIDYDPTIDVARTQYFTELNQELKGDLTSQLENFLELDTDLARASAVDIRVQMGITDSLIEQTQLVESFWSELGETANIGTNNETNAVTNTPGVVDENGIYDINLVSGDSEALEIFTNSINSYSNINNEYMELILSGSNDRARINELNDQRQTHKTNMQNMAENFNINQDGTAEDLIKGSLSNNLLIEASNSSLIPNLENQLSEFLALDTDLARASAADLIVQLGTAQEAIPEINNFVDNENDFLINLNKANYRDNIAGLSQVQLSQEYDSNFGMIVDLQNQTSEFIISNTDLANASRADVQAELLISQSHLEVLHEDHNMSSLDTHIEGAKGVYFTDLNNSLRIDLENQITEFIALDSDLARASAADIRIQLEITDELIGFWDEQTEFWNSISGLPPKDENGVLTLEIPGASGIDTIQISNDQEAQEYFNQNLDIHGDLNNQLNGFLSLNTDLARASAIEINVEKKFTEGILLGIAENFNLDIDTSSQEAQSQRNLDLNNNINGNLENQLNQFLQLDTDLARASAADIRVEMGIANNIINNEQETLNFYTELKSHDSNEAQIDDTPAETQVDDTPVETEENNDLAIINNIDNERITGTSNDDDINITGDKNIIRVQNGDDFISVEGDENSIRAGRGDDFVRIYGEENNIRAGSGQDQIEDYGESSDIRAGSGDDYISVNVGNGTRVRGGKGDDEIFVNANVRGEVLIKGGAGNDKVTLEGREEDYTVARNDRTGISIFTNNLTGARITVDGNVEDVQYTNEEIN